MLRVFTKVGFILLMFLLIINVFAFVLFGTASQPITFTALLDQMKNAPTVDITIGAISDEIKITTDWGVFNGLRDFINIFVYLLAFIIWCGTILYNVAVGIGYFIYLLGLQGFSAFI